MGQISQTFSENPKNLMNIDDRELIIGIVKKINDKKLLKRIYELAEYLYLWQDKKSGK